MIRRDIFSHPSNIKDDELDQPKKNSGRIWIFILITSLITGFIIFTNSLTTYVFVRDANQIFIDGQWQPRFDSITLDSINKEEK